jgi:beta-phosphoglucomutase family hydrolase
MPEYKALIFDCDGTLADTMPAHYVAWHKTLLRHGIDFNEDRFYSLGGVPTVQIIQLLASEAGLSLDAVAVGREKEMAFHEAIDSVEPIAAVVDIARRHVGKLPMAVGTGSEWWSAERVLKRIGVLDWFGAVVCADHVQRHKPAPDVFLEAARRLGVDPKDCCVYEDTDLGLAAGRAAGMAVVDVRPLYTIRRITK